MTRRLPSLCTSIPRLAAVFFLIIFATSICNMPTDAHAKRVESLSVPDHGGVRGVAPGQGDDDEPTINDNPGRRSTVAVTEPEFGSGRTDSKFRSLSLVKKLFLRSGSFVRRLVGFIP